MDRPWRPVPNFPEYEVSFTGVIMRVGPDQSLHPSRWRILKPWINASGYPTVRLYNGGKKKGTNIMLHRAVLAAFAGPCPPGHVGAHNDGNPGNARLENLRWATPAENEKDKQRHGRAQRGEKNSAAKLKAEQVGDIKARLRDGESQRSIGARYGVGQKTVQAISVGRTWRTVEPRYLDLQARGVVHG